MKRVFPHAIAALNTFLVLCAILFPLSGCMKMEGWKGPEATGKKSRPVAKKAWPIRERRAHLWAVAEKGLRIRKGPGVDFAPVGTLPFGAEVKSGGCVGKTTTIGRKPGRWCRVTYRGLEGYSFNAFLTETPPRERLSLSRSETSSPAARAKRAHSLFSLAYAVHNSPGLTKLTFRQWQLEEPRLRARLRFRRAAYRDCAGSRNAGETLAAYAKRAEASKRAFLSQVRAVEYVAATKTYSIYDAPLVLGGYHPFFHRFDFLGTVLPFPSPVTTLPGDDLAFRGFENGTVREVELPPQTAEQLREDPDSFRVRIDFSYTVVLEDIISWSFRAFFLPKFLLVYNRRTGEICYRCAAAQRVERGANLGAPLTLSGHFLYENVHPLPTNAADR